MIVKKKHASRSKKMRENCLLMKCGGEKEKNRRMDELLLDFYHKTKKATASKITKDKVSV